MENPWPPPVAYPVPNTYPPHQMNPDVVVSPPPPTSHNVDLVVAKTDIGYYTISDVKGKVIFKVERKVPSLSHRRVLFDSTGTPVVAMKKKVPSRHHRWQVFRGDSYEDCDLLFNVKKPSKKRVDVFHAANVAEMNCDFKIVGRASKRSCTIFSGNSSNIIAQMHKKEDLEDKMWGKDPFGLTIYPNVDYAFIVALVVVLLGQ